MAGYIGSKSSVIQVDGYNKTEADAEFLNDPASVITVSGSNVGIGTSSPNTALDVTGTITSDGLTVANNTYLKQNDNASGQPRMFGMNSANSTYIGPIDGYAGGSIFYGVSGDVTDQRFYTGSAERMRIDGSGNLLVGTTSTTAPIVNNGGAGVVIRGVNGQIYAGGASTQPLTLNREDSDGTIAEFRKDGSTVGSIGVTNNNVFLNASGGNYGILKVNGNNRYVWYETAFYPEQDNVRDLGTPSQRFDDIYATNGTIQTSDANEKQQIAALTDAEMTAAKAISEGFKTFKWNDSVDEKGVDAARIHSGVIAQEVEQAMTDAGLDAGNYAFFISTTWWEAQTDVPAVEAVAEVLDEDGNVVTEAVVGKEAYTRTDTYDTLEEAPEGATERNRKGIRYPQLLSFVGAATEQRLTSIETRLTALEVTP